jgi:putative ABC transport system permease protein
MFQDLRYAIRSLINQPGFACVVVLCLGTGIGVNATIFSVADGVLIQPFPYHQPDRIVALRMARPETGADNFGFSFQDLKDLTGQQSRLSAIGGLSRRSVTLADDGEPERYQAGAVSWTLFPMLGTTPILGRALDAQDDAPGAAGVVLLSEELWTVRYQASPAVLGRRVLVNGQPHQIVGVMPEGFKFPDNRQLWVPLAPLAHSDSRATRNIRPYARLADGATLDQADEQVRVITARLAAEYVSTNEGWRGAVVDLRSDHLPTEVTLVIWLMLGASTLVLFIACSNVANLLLARATVRRREISVRAALGAGRSRIVRQLLTESAVFGVLSVPLGLALAYAGTQMLTAAMPPDQVPFYVTWRLDWRSIVYTGVVAVGTAVLFGLVPAWQATRGTLHDELKEGTRGNSGVRSLARNVLVVAQVSLAIVSLVGAALFVRTFINLDDYGVGFDPAPLQTLRVMLTDDEFVPEGARVRRVQDLVERFEREPGVQAVFASNLVPLSGGGSGGGLQIDGVVFEPGREPDVAFVGVTPAFVRTLGTTLQSGVDFTAAEGWSRAPVAIINDTLATRYFPDVSPLGRRLRVRQGEQDPPWFTIIGVVPDIKHDDIDPEDRPEPSVYVPYAWQESPSTGFTLKVSGDPSAVVPGLRKAIRESSATIPIFAVRTMEELRRVSFWEYAIFGWVFSLIGGIALVLASVGVFGVLSYSVSQRTREMGVRIALGASQASVQALVMRQGLLLAGVGIVVGLVVSIGATRRASTLLYNVSPTDPLSYIAVSVFLLAIAAAASWIPARRAMRVNPIDALRGE